MERDQIPFRDKGVEHDPHVGKGSVNLNELGLVASPGG